MASNERTASSQDVKTLIANMTSILNSMDRNRNKDREKIINKKQHFLKVKAESEDGLWSNCTEFDLCEFISTQPEEFHWPKATHLFVVCNNSREVYHYKNGPDNTHAEEKFVQDFEKKHFNESSEIELYLSYTPCHWSCCDLLIRNNIQVTIYAVAKYKLHPTKSTLENDERKTCQQSWIQKIKEVKNAGIFIHPFRFCEEEMKKLFSYLQVDSTAILNILQPYEKRMYSRYKKLKDDLENVGDGEESSSKSGGGVEEEDGKDENEEEATGPATMHKSSSVTSSDERKKEKSSGEESVSDSGSNVGSSLSARKKVNGNNKMTERPNRKQTRNGQQ